VKEKREDWSCTSKSGEGVTGVFTTSEVGGSDHDSERGGGRGLRSPDAQGKGEEGTLGNVKQLGGKHGDSGKI